MNDTFANLGIPAAVLTAVFALAPQFDVQAQSRTPDLNNQQSLSRMIRTPKKKNGPLILQARDYSKDNKAVGIFVAKSSFKEETLTGEQIGKLIGDYLMKEYGIPSKVFVGHTDATDVGSIVVLNVNNVARGPYSLSEVHGSMERINRLFVAAHPDFKPKLEAPSLQQ